ncbi:MAG: MHS family MFS transporter [Chitinophagales bacterium]|jgi:MHS family proline/betaine transporter-like MFS transporter|nr:MHS family MFS transporter [Chitinophagales bacterium]HNL06307.1 MFS transporter [Chitinophagales bacterium]
MSTNYTHQTDKNIWQVITASSVGTLIEWYDFYIFGSLAAILAEQFFPKGNPTAAFLSTLATFAAGFIVRPFGALVFGRLGDLVGRKYTFLLTLILMGGSTFLIGCIPSYAQIGFLAPLLVLILRLVQGLALGGEYGGAATYVAEHSSAHERGYYTSFIQTTATLGLFVSLGVILLVRQSLGVADFTAWGWRIPFIVSALLVAISIYIRLKMNESPLFAKLKTEGKVSTNPLKESFGHKANLKMVLVALFGATAGQGVVWYTGQFYALSFLQKTMNVEFVQSNIIIAIALVFATPFFVVFGAWSDKVGRKWIMMAGMLLAILCYRPIYSMMFAQADLKAKTEITEQTKVDVKRELAANSTTDSLITTTTTKAFADGTTYKEVKKETVLADKSKEALKPEIKKETKLPSSSMWFLVLLVGVQVLFVTMVYGPIAAFLVELFPTRIRYSSMSLPYHIGNGVFGGLTPFIATRLYEASKTDAMPAGDPLSGLWYPIVIAGVCFVIGSLYLSNKIDENVAD